MAEVTVLVVTWRAREHLAACLDALAVQTRPHRLLVVDNASTDGSAELLASRSVETLRLPRNTGFAGGVAAGLAAIDTPLVALLNDDAVPAPDWLAALCAGLGSHAAATSRLLLADPRSVVDNTGSHAPSSSRLVRADPESVVDNAGSAAPLASRLVSADPESVVNNAGVVLRRDGYGADRGLGEPDGPPYDVPVEVFGFSGGASLLRADAVRAVGGFPARFFLYYEDTDTSWRLRLAGGTIGYVPGAVVRHGHSVSSDRRSALFHFSNERNRLLTLTRCAPAPVALRAPARFALTTGSLAAKRLLRRPVPPEPNFSVPLRLRVLLSYARLLPWALRSRREIRLLSTVDRGEVWSAWADAG